MLAKYVDKFTEARWEELCKLIKEKGMKVTSKDFTSSEIELIIDEAPISDTKRKCAKLHYINGLKPKVIADRFGYSEGDINYHKPRVSKILRITACRIFK